jgi:hypothetical protein
MHTVQTAEVRHYYQSPAPSYIDDMWASPWLPEIALRDAMVALEWVEELDANLSELRRFARHHELFEAADMAALVTEVRAEIAAEWEAELRGKPDSRPLYSKEQVAFLAHLTKVGPTKSDGEEGERMAEIRRLFPANETEVELAEPEPVVPVAPTPEPAKPWPSILPLDGVASLPRFPLEALPRTLRTWAEAVGIATQTPPELAACLGLAAVGAATAKRFEVEVKPGYHECLATWWAVIMPPAERKSANYKAAMAPIRKYESEQAADMAAKITAATTRRAVLEKQLAAAINKAAKNDGAMQDAEQAGVTLAEHVIPVVPRVTCDDVTSEKLADLMHSHGGRMALMSPEGGAFDTMSGRYSNGTPNIDIFLKGHMGEPYSVDRIGRPPFRIERAVLTMALCIQPGVVESISKMPGFRDRGLLARICYVKPTSFVGSRLASPPPVPDAVSAAYDQLITGLLELPEERDAAGEIVSQTLKLSPEAMAKRDAFFSKIEARLAPGQDLEAFRDWAGKLPGLYARIAGLLHLAGGFEGSEGFEVGVVNECEGNESEKICSFLLDHALAAFRLMGADPSLGKARLLLSWIEALDGDAFSKRDCHQAHRATFPTAEDIDAPIGVLIDHGYIRERSRLTGPQGGRPSVIFETNPSLKTLKTLKT